MEITYIGHSCFKIKGKQVTVITDPYDPKKTGYKLPKMECEILTSSHEHGDHSFKDGISSYKHYIDCAGEYEIAGVYVQGIECFHDDKSGKERGKSIMYLFDMDGFTILHLGDLGHELSQEQLEKLPDISVLMIPVGGIYTIDVKTASKVISSIEPGIVLPMHYQTADLALSQKLDPVDKFLHEMGIKGDLKPEEKLKITSKSDIPEETKVVVLAPNH